MVNSANGMQQSLGNELLQSRAQPTKSMLEQLDKLLWNGFEFLELLCRETPPCTGEGKQLARHLLTYFRAGGKRKLFVVLWAISREVETTPSNETLFRESNVQTELMFGYFYTERGKVYLNHLLKPLVTAIQRYTSIQSNPTTPHNKQFQTTILEQLPSLVDRFTVIDQVPLEFQRVFRQMKKQMNIKFPNANTQYIIISLLFLRVICPAIIMPDLIDIVVPATYNKSFAVVTAKVLQTLANGVTYDDNDPNMSVYNSFLNSHIDRVKQFSSIITSEMPEGGVPEQGLFSEREKKKDVTKDDALQSILKSLQGQAQDFVVTEHRKAKGETELQFFTNILDSPKWKLLKQRPDMSTFTAKDDNFYAVKICGPVRASQRHLQEYVRANRIIKSPPNFVKGGVVRVYDDSHADLLVTYKTDTKAKDMWISKYDFDPCGDQVVSVVWCLENQRKSAFASSLPSNFFSSSSSMGQNNELFNSNYWGAFKAVGCVIKPLPENPLFCSLVIIFKLDRKVLQSSEGIDLYLQKMLQRIRAETETPEASAPAIGAARNPDVLRTSRDGLTRNSAEF